VDLKLQRYALLALLAAALFGASTPLAKMLLGTSSPWLLAGLLYLGSGLGLSVLYIVQSLRGGKYQGLAPGDGRWLSGAVLAGGVVAPVLLLWGLSGTHASSASLLLNLEGVMTTAIAAWVFREAVSTRIWIGCTVMLIGGVLLSWQPGTLLSWRALAVIGACLCWAIDNNLTRRVSANDPVMLAMIKGLVAGSVNTVLALSLGAALPSAGSLLGAVVLGFFSYGISLVLFIYALRHLGSARTGAHFSTAPFIGAGLSLLLFHEPVTALFLLALVLMIIATWLVLAERHQHRHDHEFLQHVHVHRHDEHHQHSHETDVGPEPHTHPHEHQPVTHRHAHLPDIHHRHSH